MSNVTNGRKQEVVRYHLKQLADSSGNSVEGRKSIETIADEMEIDAEVLRDYRDGNTAALTQPFINAFAKLLGNPDAGMSGVNVDDANAFADPSNGGWYGALMAEEAQRSARLRTFQLIDQTRPEASSACDCWADLGVNGGIGEDARYAGGYEPVVHDANRDEKAVLQQASQKINAELLPDDKKWLVFRGLAKYGDQWGELSFEKQGKYFGMDKLVPRHPRTMYVHRDPKSGEQSFAKAYKQVLPGRTDAFAWFNAAEIVHFANIKNWGDLYGESIFDPCLRSYIQIESMEAGMIIRRLERASLRYKHIVDVGLVDGGDKDVRKYLDDYRARYKKIRTVDGSRNYRTQKISMGPEEDVIIPKRDNESPADVEVLVGDQYIEQIGDFMHFFAKWLAGLGPPKAHLGYEADTMRSVITDLHIVFARKVRRMQIKFIAGLNHLYWVAMVLRGIDPRGVRYSLFPPSLGTRDELVRAQVQLAHATTCRYLAQAFGQTGKQPSIQWMLSHIMGMDEETMDGLELTDVIQQVTPGAPKNDPAANPSKDSARKEAELIAGVLGSNPFVTEQTDRLQFLLDERALSLKLPSAMESLKRKTLTAPFAGEDFNQFALSMGAKRLWTPEGFVSWAA